MLDRTIDVVMAAGIAGAGALLWRSWASDQPLRKLGWAAAMLAGTGTAVFVYAAATGIPPRMAVLGAGWMPYTIAGFAGAFFILPIGWLVSVMHAVVPRFRDESKTRASSQAVALTTCVAVLLTSLRSSAPPPQYLTPEERVQAFDRSLRALKDGEREMPRDTWDPDYVVRMIGRDPQKLFAWVRDNTFWIPYHGVLRGPVGVLMDRQGNSLDRAILLATLLERAGLKVRLAHGELTDEQSADLLPVLVARRASAFRRVSRNAQNSTLKQASGQYGLGESTIEQTIENQRQTLSRIASELQRRTTDQADRLLKIVGTPESAVARAQLFANATACLKDHWWVQWQDGKSWVDLDPLSDLSASSFGPVNQTVSLHDIPAELNHEVVLRVVAEQWSRGKAKEYTVLEHVLRPADVLGRTVVLQFWPADWISGTRLGAGTQNVRTSALQQKQWDVVLAIGNEVLATATLADSGDDERSQAKGGPMSGLGSAIADSFGGASSSDQDPQRTLSAVWLEYEIRVPGETPRTIRRTVFDLLGQVMRANGVSRLALTEDQRLTRSLALTMQTEILPLASGLTPAFVAHLLARYLIKDHDLFTLVIEGKQPPDTRSLEDVLGRSDPPLSSLYSLALARLEWTNREQIYLDRPNILTRHRYPVPTAKSISLRDVTDIVANEVGVSVHVRDPFAARLAQGVLDTNAESLLRPPELRIGNAGDAFASGARWVAVSDSEGSADVNLPEDVRRLITNDVKAGYDVVAPESPVALKPEPFSGWWRIDRATGNALGFGPNGWGQAGEYSSQVGRTARISPIWRVRIATFSVAFAGNYGWCIAPMLLTQAEKDAAPLAIWQGAVKPSFGQCFGDSVLVAGITAWLLPAGLAVGAARAGSSGPSVPEIPEVPVEPAASIADAKGTAGSAPSSQPHEDYNPVNESNPDSTPPSDDPCQGDSGEGGGAVRLGPPGTDAPNKPGAPRPTPGPSPGRPISADQYEAWKAYNSYGREEAQSAYDGARQDYLAAEKANTAAQDSYSRAKSDPNTPKEVLDNAIKNANAADRTREQAEARVRGTSSTLNRWKAREARALSPEVRRLNEQSWQAKHEYQNAKDAFEQFRKENPNANAGDAAYRDAFDNMVDKEIASNQAYKKLSDEMDFDNYTCGGTGPALGNDTPTVGANASKAVSEPGTGGDPSITDPNGPPTVRDPRGSDNEELTGPPTLRDPFTDPAHAPTDPQFPAQHQIPVNRAGERNPTLPEIPPHQKTLVGLNSALHLLGGK